MCNERVTPHTVQAFDGDFISHRRCELLSRARTIIATTLFCGLMSVTSKLRCLFHFFTPARRLARSQASPRMTQLNDGRHNVYRPGKALTHVPIFSLARIPSFVPNNLTTGNGHVCFPLHTTNFGERTCCSGGLGQQYLDGET